MDHFYQSIPGWCDFADLYAEVVQRVDDGAHVVEVGAFVGQSAAAMAVEIANSGKAIRFDVVDHFQGGPDLGAHNRADQRAAFDAHTQPVRHLIREVHAMTSVEASRLYADGSLDFVFLDAQHDAPSVLADLTAWYPKVKPGGVLAGHDLDWPSVHQALKPWAEMVGVDVGTVSRRCWRVVKPSPVLVGRSLTWAPGARKALVAVCSNERNVYRQTAQSLLTLAWGQRVTDAAAQHGFADVSFAWVSKHLSVADLRNEAAAIAVGGGFSHVIFLDADMTWPADVLSRLLAHHDDGIVSGVYHLKVWPHWPVALSRAVVNPTTWNVDYTYHDLPQSGLTSVDLIGLGCAIVPTDVFKHLPEPWFAYQTKADGLWSVTEDVYFCQRAKALGAAIRVDPTIQCGHVGQQVITQPWHERSLMEMQMLAAQRGAA